MTLEEFQKKEVELRYFHRSKADFVSVFNDMNESVMSNLLYDLENNPLEFRDTWKILFLEHFSEEVESDPGVEKAFKNHSVKIEVNSLLEKDLKDEARIEDYKYKKTDSRDDWDMSDKDYL